MAELDRAGISLRLSQARERAGLTQAEIAELLSPPVHFRSIQDWESPKKHVVPFDRLDEWARLTRTSRAWLLYDEDEETAVSRQSGDAIAALASAARDLVDALGELRALLERQDALVGEMRSFVAEMSEREAAK